MDTSKLLEIAVTRQPKPSTMTHAELADLLCVSTATIARWKRDGMTIHVEFLLMALSEGKVTQSDLRRWAGKSSTPAPHSAGAAAQGETQEAQRETQETQEDDPLDKFMNLDISK